MNNKALFLLFLFLSAAYCRTFSAQPPKASDLHLQGGKSASGFDSNKLVGRGVRSDDDPTTDDPEPPTVPDPKPTITGLPDDGHTVEKRNVAGGNKAPGFDANRLVGRGVRSDDDPADESDPTTSDPVTSSDPSTDFHDDDGRPEELEKRSAGGNKAPDFDLKKVVGRGARSDDDPADESDPTTSDPATSSDPSTDFHDEDGRPEELEKRSAAGGNKAPDFDATKPIGTKLARSTLDLSVDDILGPPFPIPDPPPSTDEGDGGDDGRPEELEKRSVGFQPPSGWKRMI